MKTFKKLILVVVCFVVLLSSFVSPASAMYGDEWLYDSSSDTYYMSDLPPTPGFLVSTEPNYSGFNISKIPFHEAPKYITDIVYMGMEDAVAAGDYSTYKVPFVMVQVISSTRCRVIVGINLNVSSWYNGSGNFTGVYITAFPAFGSYQYSICYEAYFDLDDDYSVNIPWRQLSPVPVGDTFKAVRFTGSLITSSTVTDLYFYGGNGNKIDPDVTLASVPVNSSNSREQFVSYVYKGIGFSNGNFIPNIDILNPNCYLAQFLPTTPEQAEAQTQKGIWNTLKELPSVLMEKIETFFNNFLNYMLYFQKDKPEHVNPFADILTDVKEFFEDQMNDLTDFKNSLSSTLDNVVGYIQSGSGVINTFLSAVPILSAFVTFFVVFCIVRKVIGR